MYLIINSECSSIPERIKPLASEGCALLNLLHCLGYDANNPPLGDLLRRAYNLDGEWIVLSPIHWQATHNDALIMAVGKDLALQDADARLWFELFEEYLAAEDMRLHYHNAETWLLHDPQRRPLNAKPVHQLLRKSLMPELAQLDQSLFWQKFITESQMLFASKPNQSSINGLWPWGNAQLTEKKTAAICADEAFLTLAQQCSSQVILYHPEVKLKEQKILLVSDYSVLSKQHQEELEKMHVHWYWNNIAYSGSANNWLIRLWRKLIHAN